MRCQVAETAEGESEEKVAVVKGETWKVGSRESAYCISTPTSVCFVPHEDGKQAL
jgi:hypothetical protein